MRGAGSQSRHHAAVICKRMHKNTPQNKMGSKTFYCLLISTWMLLSVSFIVTLPKINRFGYDTWPHIQYSKHIMSAKKLPDPKAGWQTYQPPAYYIINQFFFPLSRHHTLYVQMASAFYGILFLLACHVVMNHWNISRPVQLASLIYFMSMPAFVYLFTAYNNDALAMAVVAVITAAALSCYRRPTSRGAILLFFLSALGMYTKYNVLLGYVAIGAVLAGALLLRRAGIKKALFILLPLFLGCLTLLPYLRFHVFAQTGHYFLSNPFMPDWNIRHTIGTLRFFLTPPGITTGEWTYPYAFDGNFHVTLEPVMFYWTKKNFLSSLLSTSLFGEFNYSSKVPSADTWAWISLWAHIIVLLNISYAGKKNRVLSGFLLASLATFGLFIMFSHYAFNSVNFRLFAWISVPLSALAAAAMQQKLQTRNKVGTVVLAAAFIIGTWAHTLYQFTLNSRLP